MGYTKRVNRSRSRGKGRSRRGGDGDEEMGLAYEEGSFINGKGKKSFSSYCCKFLFLTLFITLFLDLDKQSPHIILRVMKWLAEREEEERSQRSILRKGSASKTRKGRKDL